MINSDFLVIDLEGFRHKSQQFIPKEISVRGANYQDTILLQPPVKFSPLAEENKKTYAWLTDNLHGIVWEAGSYDHTFIFNFFNALKLRFPNSTVFTKGTEKCTFLRNFFFSVIDLDTLGCPKASQFSYCSTKVCPNHQKSYKLNHCAREKVSLFYNWLFNYFKIPIMNAVDATAKEHNLQLTLSPNLSLSVTTTSEATRDAETRIKLVKDEFKQVGSHKLLRKGVIQLTASEYSQLKSSFETIESFITFGNQNAKQTTTGSDGGPQYQTAQDATKVFSSHQT